MRKIYNEENNNIFGCCCHLSTKTNESGGKYCQHGKDKTHRTLLYSVRSQILTAEGNHPHEEGTTHL